VRVHSIFTVRVKKFLTRRLRGARPDWMQQQVLLISNGLGLHLSKVLYYRTFFLLDR
jgi:hypothetical protein